MEIEPFHPGCRDGYRVRTGTSVHQTHKAHDEVGTQIAQNVACHEDGPKVSRPLPPVNELISQTKPIRFVTDQTKIHTLRSPETQRL